MLLCSSWCHPDRPGCFAAGRVPSESIAVATTFICVGFAESEAAGLPNARPIAPQRSRELCHARRTRVTSSLNSSRACPSHAAAFATATAELVAVLHARTSGPFHQQIRDVLSSQRAVRWMEAVACHLNGTESWPAFEEALHERISL